METKETYSTETETEVHPEQDVHHVQFLPGIFKPSQHFQYLQEARRTKGFVWRFIGVILLAVLISIITVAVTYDPTLGMQELEQQGLSISEEEAGMFQVFAYVGAGVGSLFMVPLTVLISALLLLIFFTDVGFTKLFVIFAYTLPITLIESVANLPYFMLSEGLSMYSMFSLGIISQTFTDHSLINSLMGSISIGFVWGLVVLITALRLTSSKSKGYVLGVVIGVQTLLLVIFSYIGSVGGM